MCRREGGTSRLDHAQLMWGSSKLQAPIAATLWANRRSCSLSRSSAVASLHMHGQELAQSHLNAPIQTQLRKQKREGASFFKESRAPKILHTSTCRGRSRKGRGTILNLFPPAHLPEYHEMVCHICFSLLKHPSKLSSYNCWDLCQVIFFA